MLEKNKDYIEMRVSSTDCAFTQNAATQISVDGCVYTPYMRLPDPGEFYILISKEKFEKLQADVNINADIAKQWEINYDLLLKKIGFDTVEELVNYLNSEAECNTLREAIASLEYSVKFARDERRDLSKKLDECEKDYISERDKAEAIQTENEQLKKKLAVPDPIPDYKELLEKLYSKEDVEKLEWTLNHICGGRASVNGWMVSSKLWRRNLVGFSSTEEIQDYLTNEAECDTLQEAVSKLKDQVKYTCDEWYSANSTNNSWKAAAECNSPKGLIEKREALEKEIGIYSRALKEWKEGTGCPSPSVAKTLIESGLSYEYAYHESQKENRKLTEEVDSWKNVTGYSTPEDYMHAKISGAFHTPFDYTASWQKATGCSTPEEAKILIESGASWHHAYNEIKASNVKLRELEKENADLYAEIRKWKDLTKCETPEAAATWITSYESACGRGNRLAEMVEKLKEEVVSWKNVTGFSTPEDYMHARISGAFHTPFDYTTAWQKATGCSTPEEVKTSMANILINNNKYAIRKWKEATGCDTPDKAKSRIEGLENAVRLTNRNMIKELDREINEWQKFTGCDSPQKAGCKINNLCDNICKLKGDYDHLLGLTGYKSEQAIHVALNYREQFVYESMRELINSLKRQAEFTESNWQHATGCDTPEKAQCKITDLYNRIDKMKEAASTASNWTDKIVEG